MSDHDQQTPAVFADYMDGKNARVLRVQASVMQAAGTAVLRIVLPGDNRQIDWLLSDLRTIPDQADRKAIVLGRVGDDTADHPARLVVSDPGLAKRLQGLCPDLKRRHKDPNVLKRLGILSVG